MKIESIVETVYLDNWNTTAHILESRVVVMLFNNKYMDRQECFEYIHEYCLGWVESSELYREAKRDGQKIGIKSDPLLPYERLYDDLLIYAKEKFPNYFQNQ